MQMLITQVRTPGAGLRRNRKEFGTYLMLMMGQWAAFSQFQAALRIYDSVEFRIASIFSLPEKVNAERRSSLYLLV